MNRGTILRVRDKYVIVMTEDSRFVTIKRRPGMNDGQWIEYGPDDITQPKKHSYKKYMSATAALLILAITLGFYLLHKEETAIYAYVDIDINPSFELILDKESKVLGAKAINDDAKKLLKGMHLEELSIFDAVKTAIKRSEEMGFIHPTERNLVLISACISTEVKKKEPLEEAKFELVLATLKRLEKEEFKFRISTKIIETTDDIHKKARENNTSSGRQALQMKAKDMGILVSDEQLRKIKISDIIHQITKQQESSQIEKEEYGQPKSDSGKGEHDAVKEIVITTTKEEETLWPAVNIKPIETKPSIEPKTQVASNTALPTLSLEIAAKSEGERNTPQPTQEPEKKENELVDKGQSPIQPGRMASNEAERNDQPGRMASNEAERNDQLHVSASPTSYKGYEAIKVPTPMPTLSTSDKKETGYPDKRPSTATLPAIPTQRPPILDMQPTHRHPVSTQGPVYPYPMNTEMPKYPYPVPTIPKHPVYPMPTQVPFTPIPISTPTPIPTPPPVQEPVNPPARPTEQRWLYPGPAQTPKPPYPVPSEMPRPPLAPTETPRPPLAPTEKPRPPLVPTEKPRYPEHMPRPSERPHERLH